MLKVVVVGCGPIGNLHAGIHRELAAEGLVELAGVCDRLRDRADAAAARLGVTAYYDLGEMLSATQPDICDVCTGGDEYGSDHHEPAIQALEAGCDVLCEKPISNEIKHAEAMVATAARLGRRLGVNLNHRFTPAARLARRWVEEGRIGPQLFVNMAMWIKNPRETSPWFQIKALHPHTIDIMRYYAGDIECVQCFALKAPGRAVYSTAQFNMRFTSGALGHLTGSYDIERGHPMERCEVAGLNGRFVIDDMFREATLYHGALEPEHAGLHGPVKTVYTNPIFGGMRDFSDTFRNRIRKFVEQVAEGCPPAQIDGSGADGLAAQRVLAAAIMSVMEERVVYVREVTE